MIFLNLLGIAFGT